MSIKPPIWKTFVNNAEFQDANALAIQGEREDMREASRQASRRSLGALPKAGIGTVRFDLGGGVYDDRDAEELLGHPEFGRIAEEGVFKRDMKGLRDEAEGLDIDLSRPGFKPLSNDIERSTYKAEMETLADGDARKGELKAMLDADEDYRQKQNKRWELKKRIHELSSGGIEAWRKRRAAAMGDKDAGREVLRDDVHAVADADQALKEREAVIQEREQVGVSGKDLEAHEAEKNELRAERVAIEGKRKRVVNQSEAQVRDSIIEILGVDSGMKAMAGQDTGLIERSKDLFNESSFFGLNDTRLSEALKGHATLEGALDALQKRRERNNRTPNYSALYGMGAAQSISVAQESKDVNESIEGISRLKQAVEKAGYKGEEAMRLIRDTAKSYAWTANDKDYVRALSTGELAINPGRVFGEKDAVLSAIAGSGASDEDKADAVARLEGMREVMAKELDDKMHAFDSDYREYASAEENKGRSLVEILDEYSAKQKDRNWAFKAGDALLTGARKSGAGIVGTVANTVAGVGSLVGVGSGAAELGDATAAASEGLAVTSEQRGITGSFSLARDLADTVGQMAPMFAGGAAAKGMKGLSAVVMRGAGIYGWAGAQGYGSKIQDAIDIEREARGGAPLSGEEITSIIGRGDVQAAALANAAQTAILSKVLGGGAESAVAGGAAMKGITVRDLMSKGGRVALKDVGLRKALGQMFKNVAGGFTDEAVEEFTNQVLDGIISSAYLDQDMKVGDLLEESIKAGLMGGIVGGGATQVRKSDVVNQQVVAQGGAAVGEEEMRAAEEVRGEDADAQTVMALREIEQADQEVAHRARAVLKVTNGSTLDELTQDEVMALGVMRDGSPLGGEIPASIEMLNGKPIVLDAAIRELETVAPFSKGLVKMTEGEARKKIVNVPATFEVTSRGGKTVSVEAPNEEAAKREAAKMFSFGDTVEYVSPSDGVRGDPATGFDIPYETKTDTPASEINLKEVPEADKDKVLARVAEIQRQTRKGHGQALKEALREYAASPAPVVNAVEAVKKRVMKRYPFIVDSNTGSRGVTKSDGTIEIPFSALQSEAEKQGMSAQNTAQWINKIVDEEVRHLAHINAAREMWGKSGSVENYETWRNAYYETIWENDFVATGRDADVYALYPELKSSEPWKKAFEGLRMLSQQLATGSPTEIAKTWINVSQSVIDHIKAAIKSLRELLGKAMSPAIEKELAAIERNLKVLENVKRAKATKGTTKQPNAGKQNSGSREETSSARRGGNTGDASGINQGTSKDSDGDTFTVGQRISGKVHPDDKSLGGQPVTGKVLAVNNDSRILLLYADSVNLKVRVLFEDVDMLDAKAQEAATSKENDIPQPTDDQKKAGNYKVGRIRIGGMDISIENPAGSVRSGKDKDGKSWSVTMKSHYGYIRDTEGKDGDHIDLFIEEGTPESFEGKVFVVNQVNDAGEFDEHKAVLGHSIQTMEQAREEYLKNYSKGWRGVGSIAEFNSIEDFRAWVTEKKRIAPAKTSYKATTGNLDVNETPINEKQSDLTDTDEDQTPVILDGYRTIEFPVSKIKLSKDVPQFKSGADNEGVVEKLDGKYERLGTGAILLWHRKNGDFEVISGRHRYALAKSTGEATIPAQIVREADGFTLGMALTADAEANIRDGQGSTYDYANYFRTAEISREEAKKRGLLSRAKGRAGWTIGIEGAQEVFDLFANEKITEFIAETIAKTAPGNAGLQHVGLKSALAGGKAELVRNVMLAAKNSVKEDTQIDLFGFDDSAMLQMEDQAKIATAHQKEIREQIAAVQGAAKRPDKAAKMGVDVKDPNGVNKAITELKAQLERWDNWTMHSDLIAITRGEKSFALASPTAEELKAEAEEKAAKDEIEKRAAEPLKGDAGDLTADIFGEGETPLFNDRRDLSAAEQEAAKAFEGLFSSPLVTYTDGLPVERMGQFISAASSLIKEGVNTPEALAASLEKIGNGKLRKYSQAFWNAFKMVNPSLPDPASWDEIYNPAPKLDKKQAEEERELEMVKVARDIVAGDGDVDGKYAQLVEMNESLPSFTAKTSTSKINQAYSTPMPMAYAASLLADIAGGKRIYEPTAGNGALLIQASTQQDVEANELDPKRLARLSSAFPEWHITNEDATTLSLPSPADRVIGNPPFGSITLDDGTKKIFSTAAGDTTQIDHAIVLKSLENLTENGRAVFIIGGPSPLISTDKGRRDFYSKAARRRFFEHLHENYGVIDHVTLHGDLYKKQGAGWPVDVIIIQGKSPSKTALPSAKIPAMLRTWDELQAHTKLSDEQRIQLRKINEQEVRGAISELASGLGQLRGERDAAQDDRPPAIPQRGESGGQGDNDLVVESDNAGNGLPGDATSDSQQGNESLRESGLPSSGDRKSKSADPVNQFQSKYTPYSKGFSLDTLVPSNMASAVDQAFSKIASEVGDLTAFVQKELGYGGSEDIHNHFAGEQIDALAAAIYNFQKGGALIVGDQTGIGKGRIAAGLMRYAVKNDLIPIFVTEKPGLLDSMIRTDIADIEATQIIKPAILDSAIKFDSGKKLPFGKKYFASLEATGKLAEGANAIFTMYSQITADTDASESKEARERAKRNGKAPMSGWRSKALKAIGKKAVYILDESHNAAGQSITGYRLTEILNTASRVYYSSATAVKRPENMGIYFKTNIGKVVSGDMEKLYDLMQKGGVPGMQLGSYMLARDGQYLRRERSFDGAKFETVTATESAERDKALADNLTYALRQIVLVQERMSRVAQMVNDAISKAGKSANVPSTNRDKIETQNFASKIHNVVSQYLLAIKVKSTVAESIKAIREGKKVVVGLSNTMESAINDLQGGDLSYKGLVMKYLDKMRTMKTNEGEFRLSSIPSPAFKSFQTENLYQLAYTTSGLGEDKQITINQDVVAEIVRREMWSLFEEVKENVESIDLGDLPLSPIDYMRHEMEKLGVRTGEITGRKSGLDSDGAVYQRSDDEIKKGSVKNRDAFNDEDLDFLVINQSGSTGINLHAGAKMKNQAPRKMIITQPPLDINVFMQMLGRVHRSGQVKLPEFALLNTSLPAEFRPAAILSVKMAMLNANTTSNSKSEVGEGNAVVDIFNKYGDEIVYGILERDPDLQKQLKPFGGLFKRIMSDNGQLAPYQDALKALQDQPDGYIARAITGYLAIMPVEEQEIFWEKAVEKYSALIDYLDEMGANDLEAKALDMKAKTISKEIFTGGGSGDSVFDEPSYIETVETKMGKIPITGEKAIEKSKEAKKQSGELIETYVKFINEAMEKRMAEAKAKSLKWSDEKSAKLRGEMLDARNQVGAALRLLGQMGTIPRDDGSIGMAIVESVKMDNEKPFSPGAQIFTLQVNDGRQKIKLSAAKITEIFKSSLLSSARDWDSTTFVGSTRSIVTGNLLSAMAVTGNKGKVITYTTENGDTQMGILLSAAHTEQQEAKKKRTKQLATPDEVRDALMSDAFIVTSADHLVKLFATEEGKMELRVPASRSAGGKFWTNPALNKMMQGGEFVQVSDTMRGKFSEEKLKDVLGLLALPMIGTEKVQSDIEGDSLLSSGLGGEKNLAESTPSFIPSEQEYEPVRATGRESELLSEGVQGFFDSSSVRSITQAYQRITGTTIKFYRAKSGSALHKAGAFTSSVSPSVIYINAESVVDSKYLIAHEVTHVAKKDKNSGYEQALLRVTALIESLELAEIQRILSQNYREEQYLDELLPHLAGDAIGGTDFISFSSLKNGEEIRRILTEFYNGLGLMSPQSLPDVDDSLLSSGLSGKKNLAESTPSFIPSEQEYEPVRATGRESELLSEGIQGFFDSPSVRAITHAYQRITGTTIKFYRAKSGSRLHKTAAFTSKESPSLIYVNADSDVDVKEFLAHELTHVAAKDSSSNYHEILSQVSSLLDAREIAEFSRIFSSDYRSDEYESELIAYLTGGAIVNANFTGLKNGGEIKSILLNFYNGLENLKPQSLTDVDDSLLSSPLETARKNVDAAAWEEAKAQQDEFGKVVGRPDLANMGDDEVRDVVDIADELMNSQRTQEKVAEWKKEGERLVKKSPDAVKEKLLAYAYGSNEPKLQFMPEDVIASQILIENMVKNAKGDKDAILDAGAYIMAYRANRELAARVLAAGWDRYESSEVRNRRYLANAILTLPKKAMADMEGRSMSPEQVKKIHRQELAARIQKIEKALKEYGVTMDEVIGKQVYLSLDKKNMVRDMIKDRSSDEKLAIRMHQQGASMSRIVKLTKLSPSQIQRVVDDVYQDALSRMIEKVKGGDTLESLQSAPLEERPDILAEARRMVGIGLGIAPRVAVDSYMKKPRKKVESAPRKANWSRPEFTNGLADYDFDSTDLAEIKRMHQTILDLVAAQVKVRSLSGEKRAKAERAILEIDRILAKYDTSISKIIESGKPIDSYRFDVSDRVHASIVANAIRSVDADSIGKGTELWYSSVLSGIQTFLVNASAIGYSAFDAVFGRGSESLVNLFIRNPMNATLGETKYILKAMGPLLSRSMSNFAATWGSEVPFFEQDILGAPVDLESMLEGHGMYHRTAISGRKGRWLRIPSRALMATDEAVKAANAIAEVGAMAYRLCRTSGLEPETEAFDARMKELVNIPGSLAWQMAASKAYVRTFTNALPGQKDSVTGKERPVRTLGEAVGAVAGLVQHGLSKISQHGTVAKLASTILRLMFIPFVRVPYNITALALTYTPLSAIEIATLAAGNLKRKDPRVKAEIVERMARGLMGTMFQTLILGMLGEGDDDDLEKGILITGSRPYGATKNGERELGYRMGLDAYKISWVFNGKRHSRNYGRIEPFATYLATSIDTMREMKRAISGKQGWDEAMSKSSMAFMDQLSDKTFLKGLGELVRFTKGDFDTNRFVAEKLAVVMPNFIRQPTREADPYYRDRADTFGEALAYALVPYGQKEAKVDIYGKKSTKGGSVLSRIFDFTDANSSEINKVDEMFYLYQNKYPDSKLFEDMKAIPSTPYATYSVAGKTMKMNAAQAAVFREKAGVVFAARVRGLALNFDSPTERDVKLARSVADASRAAAKKILINNPNWKNLKP